MSKLEPRIKELNIAIKKIKMFLDSKDFDSAFDISSQELRKENSIVWVDYSMRLIEYVYQKAFLPIKTEDYLRKVVNYSIIRFNKLTEKQKNKLDARYQKAEKAFIKNTITYLDHRLSELTDLKELKS
jgi:DNA-binding transcriptional MerR regulator